MACKSSGGSSFSEALTYALRRLKMTRMTVKEEQRSSMRAVYEDSDVFVWLTTYWLWQEPVLPSAPFPHGLRSCRQWKELWCACCEPLDCSHARVHGCVIQTSSVKPNPFANVTIKIDVIFTFKLNACANSVYQAFPPRLKAWVRGYMNVCSPS